LNVAFADNEFDGFDFSFRGTYLAEVPSRLRQSRDGDCCYEWRKPGSVCEPGTAWQLSMNLKYGRIGRDAKFVVYRQNSSRNLLFDINMFSGDFQTALSCALDRALQKEEHAALLNASIAAALSARHGHLIGEFSGD
jgi:hypothetical protein